MGARSRPSSGFLSDFRASTTGSRDASNASDHSGSFRVIGSRDESNRQWILPTAWNSTSSSVPTLPSVVSRKSVRSRNPNGSSVRRSAPSRNPNGSSALFFSFEEDLFKLGASLSYIFLTLSTQAFTGIFLCSDDLNIYTTLDFFQVLA